MEQYQMPKKLDFKNLRLCLDNYRAIFLYIRDCGGIREDGKYSCRGRAKVSEDVDGKDLDFKKDSSGLHILIDSREVFHFPLRYYHKGFSLAYERIEPTSDGIGRRIFPGTEINPYDSHFPEPRKSTLRTVLDDHLMEIDFQGRIPLKFHSWWNKPHCKYWTIIKPSNKIPNEKSSKK